MIAAIVIPAFDLRAALRLRPALEAVPAALAPLPGSEPLLGSVTAAAEAKGVRPGMRLGEADKVEFVLLAFAEPAPWIAIGPELAAGDVLQASDSHYDSQNLGLH